MPSEDLIALLVHCFSTMAMVGVIWFVQVVHYPLFAKIGRDNFPSYEAEHQRLTTWVVAPLMFAEAGSAAWLAWRLPSPLSPAWYFVGLLLIAVAWASTFFWQVPLHRKLSQGFNPSAHGWLVRSNWLRTAVWSVRGVLALVMLTAYQFK